MEREKFRKPKVRRARLSSVANAIRLTKAFSDEHFEIGISALAVRLGLAKSTVHRLVSTLVEHGILEQNRDSGKYRPGLALFELGMLVRRKMDTATEASAAMMALRASTGETVQLAIFDESSVLYTRIFESQQGVRMSVQIGTRAPAHCTAVGKVLLAFQDADVIRGIIAAGLARLTDNTIVDAKALESELASVRARDYATDDEESEVGLRCVAAPIRDHSGQVVAAIGVSAPVQRMSKRALQACVPSVTSAGEGISRRLGHLPASPVAHLPGNR
jgi:DNA-binding IclR family transcriptional regulator